MKKIDSSFSDRIIESIDIFRNGHLSFLDNLINASLYVINDKEKDALLNTNKYTKHLW